MKVFFSLLLAVSAFAAGVNGEDGPASHTSVPGIVTRCNRQESCLPYSSREQTSFDFFCCEDGTGWVAAHSTNPLGTGFFFGSAFVAFITAALFEVFEIFLLTVFGSFVIFETNDLERETLAGAFFGDVLLQGSLGAIIYIFMRGAFNVPGPLESWFYMNTWLRIKYLLLWAAYSSTFMIVTRVGPEGQHYGLFIAVCLHAIFLFGILPFSTRSDSDERVVWQRRSYQYKNVVRNGGVVRVQTGYRMSHVPESLRWKFYAMWFFVSVLLSSQTTGLYYWAANEYYQVWTATGVVLLILAVIWLNRLYG